MYDPYVYVYVGSTWPWVCLHTELYSLPICMHINAQRVLRMQRKKHPKLRSFSFLTEHSGNLDYIQSCLKGEPKIANRLKGQILYFLERKWSPVRI